jgi:hypothetical protein
MDAITGPEVVGDSFGDLCGHALVLLCELRSPLAATRMGAELLIRLDLPEKQCQRVARNVLAATMRVEGILSDLTLLLTEAPTMSSKEAQFQSNAVQELYRRVIAVFALGGRRFAGDFWPAARQNRLEGLTWRFDHDHAEMNDARLCKTCNERRLRAFQSFLFGSALVGRLFTLIFAVAMASSSLSQTPGQDHSALRQKIDVSKLGPQVGERVPDFSLKDQNGKVWTLQSITGPKGAMLVFVRSGDW